MKISSVPNNINNSNNKKENTSFKGSTGVIYLPNVIGEVGKFIGEHVGIPEKKLIQNTTALYLQPHFDLKYGEDDEKVDVAIKSASKAIAGGITGVTIRAAAISFFQRKINFDPLNRSIINKLLLPEKAEEMYRKSNCLAKTRLKMYNETLGTVASIAIMTLFTNKNIDVPLTAFFQDMIGGVIKENKTWSRSIYDVCEERRKKFENFTKATEEKVLTVKNKAQRIVEIIKNETTKESRGETK
ncbi:MAG: hypothetical protein IJY61_01585 [Candidatus Gastranaerophilales bacterium]|nr:hypothetical protein [Candidatus Gastranaerophilales bacterium]